MTEALHPNHGGEPGLDELTRELALDPDRRSPHEVAGALETMVLHPDYPCLGARSVFNRDRATVVALGEMATEGATALLYDALCAFGRDTDQGAGFASLVAVFPDTVVDSETAFESLLWRQLEQLHEADQQPWSPLVSDDPANPHFAFSVAGTAYFVVGLHPAASRIARRTPLPTLVFNLHQQFEDLRASERFERMRDTIRRRDTALQGHVNPMVADHGAGSEARQYSGRAVPTDWAAPVSFDEENP
ncbi:guanitoxin biosynthesis heme-dependent pre-guanitoxin N-hydroxylase GntA [Pedococcus soli]